MKKTLLFAMLLLVNIIAFAGSAKLFSYDEKALNSEFSQLNSLENYVTATNYLSLSDIQAKNSYDLSAFNVKDLGTSAGQSEFVFQWEGFLWGFLCCPVGFFVIAVNKDKDHDQKLSYWIGFAASTVLSAVTSTRYYL